MVKGRLSVSLQPDTHQETLKCFYFTQIVFSTLKKTNVKTDSPVISQKKKQSGPE